MGYYVHINVCFACDKNDAVADLARKHLALVESGDDGVREAGWFLQALSERTGHNHGPKGGLSMWGMVGNYTRVGEFVEVLKPFWLELLGGIDGGPCDFEHILVFEEREQTERTTAYEISKNDNGAIEVKVHECPFAFMQM